MSITADREKFEKLMTGALDQELTQDEQRELQKMLDNDPALAQELRESKKLKEAPTTMKFKAPPPEVWENYWVHVYNRIERGIGWLIFSIGAVILLTFGGFKAVEAIINDPGLAFIAKVGILLTIGGLAVLFVSVAREKFFTGKNDPYKEIIR